MSKNDRARAMSEPRTIRETLDVWSRKDEHTTIPVVIVPASYVDAVEALVEALREIVKGKGAYNRDPLEHCANCLDHTKQLAVDALQQYREATGAEP